MLTPSTVKRSTFFPNKKIKDDSVIACVKIDLKEKIIPSNGCVLKTVIGVKLVAE